jgi:hypothetical protein
VTLSLLPLTYTARNFLRVHRRVVGGLLRSALLACRHGGLRLNRLPQVLDGRRVVPTHHNLSIRSHS